jgi:hypothetical protein
MRFSWLVLGTVGSMVACSGSVFTGEGSAHAGNAGQANAVGGSAGEPTTPDGGRAGDARGGSSSAGAAVAGAAVAGAAVGGAASGGASAAGAGGAMTALSCPASSPVVGQPCSMGLSCSYGDDPRPICRARYFCANTSKWALASAPVAGACAPIGDCAMTPSGFPVVGHECKTVGEECSFDGMASGTIYCRCSFCGESANCPASMADWACAGPPASPCPDELPNEGDPCDKKQTCLYGVPCQGATMVCDGKKWSQTEGGCAN